MYSVGSIYSHVDENSLLKTALINKRFSIVLRYALLKTFLSTRKQKKKEKQRVSTGMKGESGRTAQ